MYFFAILYGFIFIGMGFFVKKWPDTISGYSTMSPQRKKAIDIEGASSYLKKILIVIGIAVMVEYPLLSLFGLKKLAMILLCVIPISLGVFAVFGIRKYDFYKRK